MKKIFSVFVLAILVFGWALGHYIGYGHINGNANSPDISAATGGYMPGADWKTGGYMPGADWKTGGYMPGADLII